MPSVTLLPDLQETWQDMEKLVDDGLVKSIGISNFSTRKTQDLLIYARIKPVANQVEVHPYHRNSAIVEFCQAQVDIWPDLSVKPIPGLAASAGPFALSVFLSFCIDWCIFWEKQMRFEYSFLSPQSLFASSSDVGKMAPGTSAPSSLTVRLASEKRGLSYSPVLHLFI